MQKTCYFFSLLCLSALSLLNAQNTGDLAFTGFDADGDDNFAVVAFTDLAPNTTIYFSDKAWNGTAFAASEGTMTWNTGSSAIPAGTVIAFYNISVLSRASATRGNISASNMAFGASGEGVWMYLGNSPLEPTRFLAAIGTASAGTAFGTLDNTGLVAGSTAILLNANIDIGVYTGPRTGLNTTGYISALNDTSATWITQDGAGNQNMDGIPPDIPFDTTAFVITAGGDNFPPAVTTVSIRSFREWEVRFTEPVKTAAGVNSVLNVANYQITPARRIDSLLYHPENRAVTIYHEGMGNGVDYGLTVSNLADLNNNIMTAPYMSGRLVYNSTTPALRITEIMYNPPSGADSLEFIEIYNSGSQTAVLGGLELRDLNPSTGGVGQIALVFPSLTLAQGEIMLIAPRGAGAKSFFGKDFIDLATFSNVLNNGGEALVIRNSLGEVIDSVNYDDVSPWPAAADGAGPSLELKRADVSGNEGANWKPSTTLAGQVNGINVFASPGVFIPLLTSSIEFETNRAIFEEGLQGARVTLKIDQAPESDMVVRVEAVDLTAQRGVHFGLPADTLIFRQGSSAPMVFTINISDNGTPNPDLYFGLRISEVRNGAIGFQNEMVVYIKDNDQPVFPPSEELTLSYAGSFAIGQGASAEAVAFDPASNRLFVSNRLQNRLEILSFRTPGTVTLLKSVNMQPYGAGIRSVAAKGGRVAATVNPANAGNGSVVFFNTEGDFQAQVQVGSTPDMLLFTDDGKYLLTANEGEPSSDYSVDPPGSISVISIPDNIAAIHQSDVRTLDFSGFDTQKDQLIAAGIRIFGPNATVSRDLEPEFIAFDPISSIAYVTLQENNALAIVDLSKPEITHVVPLGYKDHRLPPNALDVSDEGTQILMANYPVLGMYMPDGIARFTVNGKTYLITANEGDARDYSALAEEIRFGFVEYPTDSAAFPNASFLKLPSGMGRLNVSSKSGDTDGDGDFDIAYSFGGRSFSIWDDQGKLVYDSGDKLERITAADPVYGAIFNASSTNVRLKDRSDNRGPEPEGVITAEANGQVYGFITLGRIGGVMVFNLSDPQAPYFVQYINNRNVSAIAGDRGPEGILFISAGDSPNDTAMVVVAHEVSGSLAFYTLEGVVTATRDRYRPVERMLAYPNPASETIFLEKQSDYRVLDQQGRVLRQVRQSNAIDVRHLAPGIYSIIRADGATVRITVVGK